MQWQKHFPIRLCHPKFYFGRCFILQYRVIIFKTFSKLREFFSSCDSLVEVSLDSLGALVQNINDLPSCLQVVLDSLDLTNRAAMEEEESGKYR